MTDLIFYTNPMSRGRIVRWMLEELGEPYDTQIIDYGTTMKAPAYVEINPMGKVPAIRHGDRVVTETAAICAYLADAFPAAGLAPAPAARADYYRWMFFAAGPVEAAVTNARLGHGYPDDPALQARAGFASIEATADALASIFADGRAHIAGPAFSAADVYVGSLIAWGLQLGSLPQRPALAAYAERVSARPAAIRAREIDDALLAAQPA